MIKSIFKLTNFLLRNINKYKGIVEKDNVKRIVLEILEHLKCQLERNYESVTDSTKIQ